MSRRLQPDDRVFREGVEELRRLARQGDTSDESWQEDLPEAPAIPEDADDTIAIMIPRKR